MNRPFDVAKCGFSDRREAMVANEWLMERKGQRLIGAMEKKRPRYHLPGLLGKATMATYCVDTYLGREVGRYIRYARSCT